MTAQFLMTILLLFSLPRQAQPVSQQQSAEAAFNRAVKLQHLGKFAEAVEAYRAYLTRKPDHAEAHANLGVSLARLGQYEEAIGSYETALRLNPLLTPILFNLGVAHFRAGQFAKAAESLNRFLAAAPDSWQARQLLGLALVEMGRDEEAVAQLETALKFNPNDTSLLFGLGLAYLRLDRPEVKTMIELLAANAQGLPLSSLLRGQNFLADSNYQSAIESLEAAAKLSTDLPRLHFSLGIAYLRTGRNQDAAGQFERELRRMPQDFWSLYYLAFLLEAESQLDRARERLTAALKVEPRSVEANSLLGKTLLKLGKAADAITPLEAAVAQNPKDSNTRLLLARAYQQSGRRKEAAREFAEAQRLKDAWLEKERREAPKP